MLITLQGNIGSSINTPILNTFDDIIFCNAGGKANMSLKYKNIPPMEHNDIPDEIWIKNRSTESAYSKIMSYSKIPWLSGVNTSEIPPFRFQVVYDGYDFLYYPEFKLYERPYLLLDADTNLGTSILYFEKTGMNDAKNLSYLIVGATLSLKDYNTEYNVVNVISNTTNYEVYLDRNLEELYSKNDIAVFKDYKYELQETSNILNDSTVNTLSPFKFKFINTFNSKNWYMNATIGKSVDFTLVNNVYNDAVDLWGDDKIASISSGVDIVASLTSTLNVNLTTTDTELELTNAPTIPLDLHSYLTIKSANGIEIVKIIEKESSVKFTIERGQLDTIALEHTTDIQLYFPKYIYFVMLPLNKQIDKRYVVYRNVDFVLTWV